METKQTKICPKCNSKIVVKNGWTKKNKRGERMQKYLCTECRRQFVAKKESLSRTEKRLFSLLYNLITCHAQKYDDLKSVVNVCNKEDPLIGDIELKIKEGDIDFNELKNVVMAVCYDEDENKIEIVKNAPETNSVNSKQYADKLKEELDRMFE